MERDPLRRSAGARRAPLATLLAGALLVLAGCQNPTGGSDESGGTGEAAGSGPTVSSVLENPRDHLNGDVILGGDVTETVGLRAFVLGDPGGSASEGGSEGTEGTTDGLLVVRVDRTPAVAALGESAQAERVFEGDTVQVGGPMFVFNLERFEAAIGQDLEDDLFGPYEGKPAVLALVLQRTEDEEGEGTGN